MKHFPLRSDRFATLYLVRPFNRVFSNRLPAGIPVLMYHSISRQHIAAVHPYYQTVTDPEVFRTHMALLDKSGWNVIRLKDVGMYMQEKKDSKRCVAITFDDGYRDFADIAFPILEKYNFTATVFIATGYVGRNIMNLECLDWKDIQDLAAKGIDFGSHTVTHPKLYALQEEEIRREIRGSKDEIENKTGLPVRSFSYPYAFPQEDRQFIKNLRKILEESGIQCGVTTRIGLCQKGYDPLFIRRIPVNAYDDQNFFKSKLAGDYDWLSRFQYVRRLFSNNSASRGYGTT